jgi:hypothetical protein
MRWLMATVSGAVLVLASSGQAAMLDLKGAWLVEDKSAQIAIDNCNRLYWGVVLWERTPGRDRENPDPSLRGRPTLGIPILLGMRPAVPPGPDGLQGVWRGQIYNAMNGQTYDASIKLAAPDVLHLEGCVLGGLFCGGQNWARVPPATPMGDVCGTVASLARGLR